MNWILITGMIVFGIAACAVVIMIGLTTAVTAAMADSSKEPNSVWQAALRDGWYDRMTHGMVSLLFPVIAGGFGMLICAIHQGLTTNKHPTWLGYGLWLECAILIFPMGFMLMLSVIMWLPLTVPNRLFIVAFHLAALMGTVGMYALILIPVMPGVISAMAYAVMITPFVVLLMVRVTFITARN